MDIVRSYIVSGGGGMNIGVILLLPSEVLVSICLFIGPLIGVDEVDNGVVGVTQLEIG